MQVGWMNALFPLMVLLAKWPIIYFFKELSIVQGAKNIHFLFPIKWS